MAQQIRHGRPDASTLNAFLEKLEERLPELTNLRFVDAQGDCPGVIYANLPNAGSSRMRVMSLLH